MMNDHESDEPNSAVTDDLPPEFVAYAKLRAAAYSPRQSAKKATTPEQVEAKTLLKLQARLEMVETQLEGISRQQAIDLVNGTRDKAASELHVAIVHHLKIAQMRRDKAVADERLAEQRSAADRLEQLLVNNQQFMQQIVDKLDQAMIAAAAPQQAITDDSQHPTEH